MLSHQFRLLPHLVLGLMLIVGLNVFLGTAGFYSADELVAHRQVEVLDAGSWTLPVPEPSIDPDSRWNPLNGVSRGDGIYAPYAKHPAFPLVVQLFDQGLGRMGRFLAVSVGAIAAAVLVSVGSDRRAAGSGPVAFWLMLLGTPMILHASVLWGHSIAIAGAGLAMLGVQRVVSEHRADLVATASLAAGALVALSMRSEALLFFVILGAVLTVSGLIERSPREVGVGVGLGALTVAFYIAEYKWRFSLLGPSTGTQISVPSDPMFDLGIRAGLIGYWLLGSDAGPIGLLRVVGLALLVSEGRHLSKPDARPRMAIVGSAVVCVLFGIAAGPTFSFLVGAPLVIIGLTLVRSPDRLTVVIAFVSAIFFAAVVMTSYETAGGGDWGGRYLSLLLAPLVLLAGPELIRVADDRRFRGLLAAGTVASICVAVGIVHDVRTQRGITVDLLEESVAELDTFSSPSDIVVLTDPRMGRLLGEAEVDRRLFQVAPEELEDFAAAIEGHADDIVVFDFLNPVELSGDWLIIDEGPSMRRVAWTRAG